MNTKALNALAGVICRAQEQDRTPMGIAFAVDSAGLHMSPETAAELERARLRVDEVERAYTFDTAELKRRIAELEAERDDEARAKEYFASQSQRRKDRISALEAERHSTNEALDDAVQALREKEKREAVVAEFVAARAEYITALRNCHGDNTHDYDRWQGHAAARRQLSELLDLPVAWPPEDPSVTVSAEKLAALLAPSEGGGS